MRLQQRLGAAFFACVIFGSTATSAFAQDNAQAVRQKIDQLRRDFDLLKQQYGDRLSALEGRLATLQGGQPAPLGQPPAPTAPTSAEGGAAAPVLGASVSNAKVFNPDIAVIGDFLYRITDPVLRPIRNMLPSMGGIDISPVILFLIIVFIRYVIALYILPNVY